LGTGSAVTIDGPMDNPNSGESIWTVTASSPGEGKLRISEVYRGSLRDYADFTIQVVDDEMRIKTERPESRMDLQKTRTNLSKQNAKLEAIIEDKEDKLRSIERKITDLEWTGDKMITETCKRNAVSIWQSECGANPEPLATIKREIEEFQNGISHLVEKNATLDALIAEKEAEYETKVIQYQEKRELRTKSKEERDQLKKVLSAKKTKLKDIEENIRRIGAYGGCAEGARLAEYHQEFAQQSGHCETLDDIQGDIDRIRGQIADLKEKIPPLDAKIAEKQKDYETKVELYVDLRRVAEEKQEKEDEEHFHV